MGNFLVGTLRFYPAPLARAGFPTLVLETRMGNVGQIFGQAIFDEAVKDLDAAAKWLREQGFDHLIASGYSSGATLATRFAATRHLPTLRGLACMGNPWGLPQSLENRARRWNAKPSYEEVVAEARDVLRGWRRRPPRPPVHDRAQPRARPSSRATARSTPSAPGGTRAAPRPCAAMAHRQIGQVRAPILLVQGTADEVVGVDEAEALARVARESGNRDVEVVHVEGGTHSFKGHEIFTRDTVIRWLRRVA